jgi:hypothetical protein
MLAPSLVTATVYTPCSAGVKLTKYVPSAMSSTTAGAVTGSPPGASAGGCSVTVTLNLSPPDLRARALRSRAQMRKEVCMPLAPVGSTPGPYAKQFCALTSTAGDRKPHTHERER